MQAKILNGKAIAETIRQEIATNVAEHVKKSGVVPSLCVIIVGENAASRVYVRNKQKACEQTGIKSRLIEFPSTISTEQLLEEIERLNADSSVHGILVQLPLPKEIDEQRVLDAVSPLKDVDAFHAENVGLISQGRPRFLPCTPYGVCELLRRCEIETSGKHVVILGRSNIVGKPMAQMLIQKGNGADATVTICHSRSQNLKEITRLADILIVAIGQARFVKADFVKPGAVVIDVGMNRDENNGLCGDVDFAGVSEIAGAITPVPGGVGPLTVTMLLKNTLSAASF